MSLLPTSPPRPNGRPVQTRSRLCRACLLEAAEQVARLYLPRTAPMRDIAPAAYDSDNNIVEEGEEEEEELPHDVSQSGPAVASPARSQRASSSSATVIGPVAPSNRMLLSHAGDSTADGGGGTGSTEGVVVGGLDTGQQRSYWRLKQANGAHRARRAAMLSTSSFSAWLVGCIEQQEFAVDENGVVPLLACGRA